jgi:predicted dinucleotide-binding enzyme
MFRMAIPLLCFFGSGACIAGELIRDAVIVEVANTYSGGADFAIRVEGGTGVCAGTTFIVFPESRKASVASFNQAFAAALAALASDKKVRIHNFVDDSCSGASFISVSR